MNGTKINEASLTPIAPPLWAYFRQLFGKEFFAAQSVQAQEEVLIIVNWRNDIAPQHAVRYAGVDYGITRVDTLAGYKEDITLYCKKRNGNICCFSGN